MHFAVKTLYDQTALTAMAHALRKTLRRRRTIAVHVLAWFVIFLEVICLLLIVGTDSLTFGFRELLSLLVAVLVFAVVIREDAINGWLAGRRMLSAVRESETVFDDTGYTTMIQGAQTRWAYGRIQKVCETADFFVCFLGKKHGQIFAKSGFTQGTPEEFRTFIAETTGKPAQYIK